MKLFNIISYLVSSACVFAAPAPITNSKILSDAILAFQETSTSSFELINAALNAQASMLNVFALSNAGEVSLFLPSDAGFLGLNIATVSQNDLYTYLQYHFSLNSLAASPAHLKTYLGDDVALVYTAGELSSVVSGLDTVSNVIGTSNPIPNVHIYFIDKVLKAPPTIEKVAAFYNWTSVALLFNSKSKLSMEEAGKDNTIFIPSETSIKKFLVDYGVINFNSKIVSDIVNLHHVSIARIYSEDLTSGASVVTSEGATITFVITDGIVTIVGPVNNVTVIGANYLAEHGVAHITNGVLLPYKL